jgi:hypothetical protein
MPPPTKVHKDTRRLLLEACDKSEINEACLYEIAEDWNWSYPCAALPIKEYKPDIFVD